MSLQWHVELERFVEYVVEIIVVELRSKKRIAVHCQASVRHIETSKEQLLLPGVNGCKPAYPFSFSV